METRAAAVADTLSEDRATLEVKQINSGLAERDLKKEADERDHERGQRFKEHFEKLSIFAMYVLFAMLFVFGVIWAWHMVAPPYLRWLTPDEITVVQDVLTGGLVAGLIADHFKRRVGRT